MSELSLDVGEGRFQSGAADGAGGAFVENAVALKFESLTGALTTCFCGELLGSGWCIR